MQENLLAFLQASGQSAACSSKPFELEALCAKNHSKRTNSITVTPAYSTSTATATSHAVTKRSIRMSRAPLAYCSSARILKQGDVIMHYNILRSSIAGLFTKLRGSDLHYWYILQSEKPILEYGIPFFYSPRKIYQALVSSGRPMGREVLVMVD